MSHRDPQCHDATARWLAQIGLPYDDLYCAHDKLGHCLSLGVDLLVDDSPENLLKAIDHGLVVATISHPWNRDLCEEEDVICGADWRELGGQARPRSWAAAPTCDARHTDPVAADLCVP